MNGSEKQIKWSIEIRDRIIGEMDVHLGKMDAGTAWIDVDATRQEQYHKIADHIKKQDDAKYWIDRRSKTGETILLMYGVGEYFNSQEVH